MMNSVYKGYAAGQRKESAAGCIPLTGKREENKAAGLAGGLNASLCCYNNSASRFVSTSMAF